MRRVNFALRQKAAKALEACEYAEHIGFVFVALIDVLDLGHSVLRMVSIWLLFSGAGVLYRQRPGGSAGVSE